MTYKQLDLIADSINPLLIVLLIALPFLMKVERPWLFLLRAGGALLVTWLLAKGVKGQHLLGAKAEFPSTHWAVTLTVVTSMIILRTRVALILVPVALVYGGLILFQRYHTLIDLIGALYAVPLTALFHWPLKRREPVAALDA